MKVLIDIQDVIDLLQMNREEEYKKSLSAECEHKSVIRSKHDAHVAFCDYLIECVKQLPTHKTPSNTLGALDCVERQVAIDALMAFKEAHKADRFTGDLLHWTGIKAMIENLPSVQAREIKCEKCYWNDEKGCSIFCRAWNRYTAHGGYCHQYADMRGDSE